MNFFKPIAFETGQVDLSEVEMEAPTMTDKTPKILSLECDDDAKIFFPSRQQSAQEKYYEFLYREFIAQGLSKHPNNTQEIKTLVDTTLNNEWLRRQKSVDCHFKEMVFDWPLSCTTVSDESMPSCNLTEQKTETPNSMKVEHEAEKLPLDILSRRKYNKRNTRQKLKQRKIFVSRYLKYVGYYLLEIQNFDEKLPFRHRGFETWADRVFDNKMIKLIDLSYDFKEGIIAKSKYDYFIYGSNKKFEISIEIELSSEWQRKALLKEETIKESTKPFKFILRSMSQTVLPFKSIKIMHSENDMVLIFGLKPCDVEVCCLSTLYKLYESKLNVSSDNRRYKYVCARSLAMIFRIISYYS